MQMVGVAVAVARAGVVARAAVAVMVAVVTGATVTGQHRLMA